MFNPHLKKFALALALALALSGSAWAGYAIVDLGSLGGGGVSPAAVNNSGDVVGSGHTTSNAQHAFLYSSATGSISDLHYALPINGGRSVATAINNVGLISGFFGQVGTTGDHGFLYNSVLGTATDLGTLGGSYSEAFDLNNNGDTVGYSTISGNNAIWHAFLYTNGTMIDLGGLPGYTISMARAINNYGDIVGTSWGSTSESFVYSNGIMTNIGGLGGNDTWALDINDSGEVVGYSVVAGSSAEHAFLYVNGVMTDLGTLGGISSVANSINNSGDIVGIYRTTGPGLGYVHPFLYSNGAAQDLNTLLPAGSGWTLQTASSINDLGMIVGTGSIGGENHAFLMAPGCGE